MKITISVRNGEQSAEASLSCLDFGTPASGAVPRRVFDELLERLLTDVRRTLDLTATTDREPEPIEKDAR